MAAKKRKRRKRFSTHESSMVVHSTNGKDMELDFRLESSGTRKVLHLFLMASSMAERYGILIIQKRALPRDADDDEEAALQRLNRLFAKAAPIAARENAAALARFNHELAAHIRRAAP